MFVTRSKGTGLLAAAGIIGLMFGLPATAQVLDGNIADLPKVVEDTIADSQGQVGALDDPLSELASGRTPPQGRPSGLNVVRARAAFLPGVDGGTYYIGLDLQDNNPFDADDNLNASTVSADILGRAPLFSDTDSEQYRVRLDIGDNGGGLFDITFSLNSADGNLPAEPNGLVVENGGGLPAGSFQFDFGTVIAGSPQGDVEFRIKNLTPTFNISQLFTLRITVTSGSTGDFSEEDNMSGVFNFDRPRHAIEIEKTVACGRDVNGDGFIDQADANALADGSFSENVTALPDAVIFWRIKVRNPGVVGVDADCINVRVTDPVLGGDITNKFPAAIEPLSPQETVTATIIDTNTVDTRNVATVRGQNAFTGEESTDTDDANEDIVVPCLDCTVLLDDDANFDNAGDTTPPSETINLADRPLPISITVFITVRNCGELALENIQLTSATLVALGFAPPAPFSLNAGASQRFPFTFNVNDQEDCARIAGLDGSSDGVLNINVTTTGQVKVTGGSPCVFGDKNHDGRTGAGERVDSFTKTDNCSASLICQPEETRVPTLSQLGLALLAAGLAFVMIRRSVFAG